MSERGTDIFLDEAGRPRVLLGAAVYSRSTWVAELAARCGFDAVWLELEHGPASFETIESLCLAVEAGGGIPVVRIPDTQRVHVLRTLEVGARVLLAPMVSTVEQARDLVAFGKFPPLGRRGYNTRTRGVRYGLRGARNEFAAANERTYLFAQIETREAVANQEAILSVQGLAGVLVGPGDLSASLGCLGEPGNPELIRTATDCIRRARGAGKHAGILTGPGPMLDAAIEAGCDLVFCAGDIMDLATAWPKSVAGFRDRLRAARQPASAQAGDGGLGR